jgi:hypothetical protein
VGTTTFRETMTGTYRGLPMRLDLEVRVPGVLNPWADTTAAVTGTATIGASTTPVRGEMRIAPVRARQIRYRLDLGDDRHLDGWKTISYRHPVRSMTTLPATITDGGHNIQGEARMAFRLATLPRFLASLRWRRPERELPQLTGLKWRGQRGRLEVWYTTLTDPATGTGVWLHHELVAPADGGPAYTHGWVALFPPGEPPVVERYGPTARVTAPPDHGLSLTEAGGPTLYTFPRWAWRSGLLPAAQIVPAPAARYTGTVHCGGRELSVVDGRGANARIYGHGNAQRWAWLHADLGAGDVCEVVAAVSTRPGLRRLRPLPLVRLRVGGVHWPPGDPLLAAPRFHAEIGLPQWTVRGTAARHTIAISVTQPPEATLAMDYTDPDGAKAVCHNSERADATIVLDGPSGRRTWQLDGTAHAEVGTRD